MRKALKVLIAAACVLLAVAVALLIYLEFGRQDDTIPSQDQTESTSGHADVTTAPQETSLPEETTVPEETDYVPETQEGGMPVYPFEGQETTPSETEVMPTEGVDTDATEGTYVPDEDELPQMPL